jgi:hypothetical protein
VHLNILKHVVSAMHTVAYCICTGPTRSSLEHSFISDDVWGGKGVCRVISRSISAYLVQAWDVRNSCKHNGAVLPLSAAPVGRGADGVDAMA